MNINRFSPSMAKILKILLLVFLNVVFVVDPRFSSADASGLSQISTSVLSDELRELLVEKPSTLPSFTLTDSKGNPFTGEQIKGKWTFLFFGYTNCPDVCPETLTELDSAASKLAAQKNIPKDIQYVFISIDPRRDTPALLGQYLQYFSASYIGATGSIPELTKLANSVNIGFEYGPGDKNYEVAHGSALLLISPQLQYIARFRAPQYSEDIVDGFNLVYNYYTKAQK